MLVTILSGTFFSSRLLSKNVKIIVSRDSVTIEGVLD
jgi:hypothetical protein